MTLFRRRIAPVALILLLAGAGWWWYAGRPAPPWQKEGEPQRGRHNRDDGPRPVTVGEVKITDLPVWLTAIGTVTPLAQVTVRPRVDGELEKIHFQEGSLVREGDLLAEIDARPFRIQARKSAGQLTRDAALLDNARLDLKRYQDLWSKDAIAKQQVDAQEALVRQYQGTVESDKGEVENARLQLEYTRITAPIDGRIGLRQVDRGNTVRANDTAGLAVITQLRPIAVLFSLPEGHLQALLKKLAAAAPVTLEILDRDRKSTLATGRLVATDSLIDASTGTIRLKGEFLNEDLTLFPNQFVQVRLLMETLSNAVTVPSAAIQQGPKGSHLFRVGEENTVSVVSVTPGAETNGLTEVRDTPLQAGERVVLEGIDRLREGSRVAVVTPGAPPPAAPQERKEWRKKQSP
ncbi:MAG: MdtA/MuxA family multidrug efflux RND transporter periplasmic adaptor subunit [Magnetococcales bacterium]|nr:MdtA/MuxA family multidrug efflux RND transporter periplasmic adaptor subunit [Magnetococcales bacterium]